MYKMNEGAGFVVTSFASMPVSLQRQGHRDTPQWSHDYTVFPTQEEAREAFQVWASTVPLSFLRVSRLVANATLWDRASGTSVNISHTTR